MRVIVEAKTSNIHFKLTVTFPNVSKVVLLEIRKVRSASQSNRENSQEGAVVKSLRLHAGLVAFFFANSSERRIAGRIL